MGRGFILNAIFLSYHLLGLLLCPWTWGIFFGGTQHSAVDRDVAGGVVQQLVVILEFSIAEEDKHTSFYSATL